VQKNKTFYFLSYEGLRQTWGQTLPGFVPTDAFKAQAKAQSPELAPILDAYPEGQIAVSATQAEFAGAGKQIDQEDSGMLRVDHVFSEKSTAYLRFNFDAAVSNVPLAGSSNQYLLDKQETTSRPVNGTIEFLHLFSPALVNEAKFGFNRGTVFTSNQAATNLPYSVAVSGFSTLNNNEFKVGVGNSFSYIDNLTWVHGKHTAKFGVEVRRIQLNQGNTANGSITFASAAQFQANQVSSASYAAALPVNGLRKTSVFAFAQDEWKLKPNLTLNAGVRYSFFNRFSEVLGRANPFDFATCGPQGFCGPGAEFSLPRKLNIDPRISLAWSPHIFAGKTVIRSGFGIYHGDEQLDDQNLPISNEVARYSLSSKTTPALSFPIDPFLADTPGIVSPRDMDRHREDMYVTQWGTSIQQTMPAQFVGTLSYVGSQAAHIITTSYINLIDPATGQRQYPNFGQVEYRGNENNSSYEALSASLQRSFSNGLLAGANYMWAHAIDDGSAGGGDADFPGIPGCSRCERSSSDFDVRSTFNANLVYEIPFERGGHGFLAAALSNWQLMGIATARTGLPVNVTVDRSSSDVATGYTTNQRPDRLPNVSLTPRGGSSIGHWINPAAFAVPQTPAYGTAGRNLVRGPNLWQMDTGLAKHIPVGESVQLELRGEVFNIFNRAQYGSPLADISSDTFGQIINTVNVGPIGTGTPRQVQFAARFQF
jgi:TonB-dependent receptor-like protein